VTTKAAAKPRKAGNCTSNGTLPAPSAPFFPFAANQGMAESQQVPLPGPARRRELVTSPTIVDQCYVACTAYVGGAVPFYFQVDEATNVCSCCSGICTIIFSPAVTVRHMVWFRTLCSQKAARVTHPHLVQLFVS
jgi:hypothetical protein